MLNDNGVPRNIFILNKPINKTSNEVIQEIKAKTKVRKIGHGGTLDPIATGVLVVGINKGTKQLTHNLNEVKEYIVSIEFGYSTETYDIEGKIIKKSDNVPSKIEVKTYCNKLLKSPFLQQVPLYSAVKVNGKELYKYARENLDIPELPSKMVELKEYELLSYDGNTLKIRLVVSKGFYIRSFVNDLANYTNSCATMIGLVRTKSGDFCLKDAIGIEELIDLINNKKASI